jgi:hypothetical protein
VVSDAVLALNAVWALEYAFVAVGVGVELGVAVGVGLALGVGIGRVAVAQVRGIAPFDSSANGNRELPANASSPASDDILKTVSEGPRRWLYRPGELKQLDQLLHRWHYGFVLADAVLE